MKINTLASIVGISSGLLLGSPASADVVQSFSLSDFSGANSTTITGSFDFDQTTQTIPSWNIVASTTSRSATVDFASPSNPANNVVSGFNPNYFADSNAVTFDDGAYSLVLYFPNLSTDMTQSIIADQYHEDYFANGNQGQDFDNGIYTGVAIPSPEPSSIVLMIGPCLVFLARRRRASV